MKNLFYLLILAFQFGFSQTSTDSVNSISVRVFRANYKDFLTIGNKVYAVTTGDSLVSIDLKTNNFEFIKKNISTIVKTSKDSLIIGTKSGRILSKNGKTYEKIFNVKTRFFKLLIDKDDNYVSISDRGIHYLNKAFYPRKEKISHPQGGDYNETYYFAIPDFSYLDTNNILWLTYDRGEFGESIIFFDLNTKIFFEEEYLSLQTNINDPQYDEKLQKEYPDKIKKVNEDFLFKFPYNLPIYRPIKGICQDEQSNFYFSQSLMHFFVSGSISKYIEIQQDFYKEIDLSSVLKQENNIGEGSLSFMDVAEYLGPIQFNEYDGKVYYYTDNGFFKILQNDTGLSKELIFKPTILWKFGLENSVGYEMNVKKFEFISEREIVFLTSFNGIGYYDGKSIKYFQ